MIDLNTAWFILIGVFFAGYAILDGFDLGVGVLHLFARDNMERRINLNAIGPVWDGNEVWLLTGGGALFAAFPPIYATVFSGFYIALMLLLAALMFRAVSLEFRSKIESPTWHKLWDWSFGIGSLLPAVLLGVAFGNILRGVPIDANGMWAGSFLGLLNPYAIIIGILSLVVFVTHGALYMTLKTDGELQNRMANWASRGWVGFVVVYFIATLYTFFEAPHLLTDSMSKPLFWVFFIALLGSIVYLPIALKAKQFFKAFLCSAVSMTSIIFIPAISIFPIIVPSSIDMAYSLTAYNASSTPRTLKTMLIIALIGMPIVIGYTWYIYRMFKGKTVVAEDGY